MASALLKQVLEQLAELLRRPGDFLRSRLSQAPVLVTRAQREPSSRKNSFTTRTVDIAGELYGNGGHVQRVIADIWAYVGLSVPLFGCAEKHTATRRRRQRVAALALLSKWRSGPRADAPLS